MSTRATIKVEGINFAKVYKHYDGYPSSTLPWLEEFNERFSKKRGDDPEYKFAQLLRSSAFECDKFGLDESKQTGWGVIPDQVSYGEEYEYTLKSNGTVTYREIE